MGEGSVASMQVKNEMMLFVKITDRAGDHHAKQNKPDSEKFHIFSLICRVWGFGYVGVQACGRDVT